MITVDLSHPFIVGLLLAVIVALGGAAWAMVVTVRDLRSDVLPHFQPAKPGQADVSLPARTTALEHEVHELREGARDLAADLREHMADEARARQEDSRELRASLGRVHDRIDALTKPPRDQDGA